MGAKAVLTGIFGAATLVVVLLDPSPFPLPLPLADDVLDWDCFWLPPVALDVPPCPPWPPLAVLLLVLDELPLLLTLPPVAFPPVAVAPEFEDEPEVEVDEAPEFELEPLLFVMDIGCGVGVGVGLGAGGGVGFGHGFGLG